MAPTHSEQATCSGVHVHESPDRVYNQHRVRQIPHQHVTSDGRQIKKSAPGQGPRDDGPHDGEGQWRRIYARPRAVSCEVDEVANPRDDGPHADGDSLSPVDGAPTDPQGKYHKCPYHYGPVSKAGPNPEPPSVLVDHGAARLVESSAPPHQSMRLGGENEDEGHHRHDGQRRKEATSHPAVVANVPHGKDKPQRRHADNAEVR